jgi:hypothetical protein
VILEWGVDKKNPDFLLISYSLEDYCNEIKGKLVLRMVAYKALWLGWEIIFTQGLGGSNFK